MVHIGDDGKIIQERRRGGNEFPIILVLIGILMCLALTLMEKS